MRPSALAALSAVLLAFAAGCPDRTVALVPPQQQGQSTKFIPISSDIDILFVIDDSPSTADKQAVFVSNFPKFVQALDMFAGGRPNVHIGVVSSSVDIKNQNFGTGCPSPNTTADGRLQNAPRQTGCSAPTDKYLIDVKDATGGGRTVNYSGTLDAALGCIAQLGTGGCGFEAQLEAMKKALDGHLPENAGFLRPGAYLAVIFLTDEDDCSVQDYSIFNLDANTVGPGDFRCQPLYAYDCDQPISATAGGTYHNCTVKTGSYLQDTKYYHDFLAGLKSEGQVVVAVLGGDPKSDIDMTGAINTPFVQSLALLPSCMATINGNPAIGRPGIRLNDFVQQFGDHGLYDTICQSDYSGALMDIGQLLFTSVSPCLDGAVDPTDKDPNNPGIQPDCAVSDVVNLNTPQQSETQIPTCPMTGPTTPDPNGPRPCWWIASDPASCMTAPNLDIHVERSGSPPAGDNVEVSCAIK